MSATPMTEAAVEDTAPRRRFSKRWLLWLFVACWGAVGFWNTVKPMPPGTDVQTEPTLAPAADVRFLYDLTRADTAGAALHEQQIFDEVFRIIDGAETFIIADFFLINDHMGASSEPHRRLSRELADRLIARKAARPAISILLITDPINEVYGGAPLELLEELRRAGIEVVMTDLERLRDSNPGYSALWRMFAQWWGNSAGGSMSNPFEAGSPGVSLRSWLALLNFKANHRKVLVADREDGTLTALVTSANPHDASSAHSNVAVSFTGALAEQVVGSELAVARFSGWRGNIYASTPAPDSEAEAGQEVRLSFITESAIQDHLLAAIDATRNGDSVRVATFYLSERRVVDALLEAAGRGATVRLILDPNRDAFGMEKDGVPNRPVANELVRRSGEQIEVRWYRTHGEQFHTKLALITQGERLIASLGSANLTRRNIGNYNLEANVAIEAATASQLGVEMMGYFDRIWNNDGPPGTEYTAPFGAYRDTDRGRYWRYRIMEATGLSTF
jgi:phosphatidylserine/phosphatidylglycerophosphate/cardiolipin synthase-like enzyme